jgi:hypothetical protein
MWLEEEQYNCKKDLMELVMMNYDASSCLLVCTVMSMPVCCSLSMVWFFKQKLANCFCFTTVSWSTGQFSTLVTFVSSYETGKESAYLLCKTGFL